MKRIDEKFNIGKFAEEVVIERLGLGKITHRGGEFIFRCPFCGHDHPNEPKGSFTWKADKQTHVFGCWRKKGKCASLSGSALSWYLKKEDENLWKETYFPTEDQPKIERKPAPEYVPVKLEKETVEEIFEKMLKEQYIYKVYDFFKIDEDDLVEDELKMRDLLYDFLSKRQLPKNIIKEEFYVTTNYYADIFVNFDFLKTEQSKTQNEDVYERDYYDRDLDMRVFWLVKNEKDEIIGITGRALDKDAKIRYNKTKIREGENLITGLHRLNIRKPVFITEGYLDSLFLPNAVSIGGLASVKSSINHLISLGVDDITLVLDNDDSALNYYEKVSEIPFAVNIKGVIWDTDMRENGKDINEYYVNGYDIMNIVEKYTVDDIFSVFK